MTQRTMAIDFSPTPPFVAIIPARYASTRLPGKPLLMLAGKPMVQHVYERAMQSGAHQVWIATDDARIADVAHSFGAQTVMTATNHRSGTERLAEAVSCLAVDSDTVVVNVQGDEPTMPPALIRQVAQALAATPEAAIATLCHAMAEDQFNNPNVVKVVRDARNFALYFSRAPIPWPREPQNLPPLRHIGLYAYRASFLRTAPTLPPSPLERIESLEQLRWLYHGAKIVVEHAEQSPGPGVDTPADVAEAERCLRERP